jgi:hypothetical protein
VNVGKAQAKDDPLAIPKFLDRKSAEFKKLAAKAKPVDAKGRVVTFADPDAHLHALAAELGFKRHHYRVEWFRDEKWVARQREEKAKRDATEEEKAAKRKAQREADRAERALMPKVKRERTAKPSTKKLEDLPAGRIVVMMKKNPYREGSTPHERYEILKKYHGMTVEAYVLGGGNPTPLKNNVAKKYVRVVDDGELEEAEGAGAAGADTERAAPAAPADKPRGKTRKAGAGAGSGKKAKKGR